MWNLPLWITLCLVQNMWQEWGIQFLVVLSLFGQVFLAILGRRRRYMTSWFIRLLLWAAYLLSTYVATIALGKLTTQPSGNTKKSCKFNPRLSGNTNNPCNKQVLLGLLAPVLLIHLGNPISITAFSIEDLQLGFRAIVNIAGSVILVVWVLIRCWDDKSPVSWLYLPLFLAGAITTGGWVWGLYFVFRGNSNVTFQDMDFHDEKMSFSDEAKDEDWKKLKDSSKKILRAFYRFDCLKPHIHDWPYHPIFVTLDHTTINEDNADEVFKTTEIELSFMYDTLYTRAPILYTWLGMIGRFIIVSCIASAVWGFSVIHKEDSCQGQYTRYTFVILIAVLAYELYQSVLIGFSDWAVVKMIRLRRIWIMWRIIHFVAKIRIKRKRWSGNMGQLNLFDYCHRVTFWKPILKLLLLFKQEEAFRKHLSHTRVEIPAFFKEMLLDYMKQFELKRKKQPFSKRGDWTFEIHEIHNDALSSSIEQGFDKSIITWHIATEICFNLLNDCDKKHNGHEFVKKISDYMMYLVALRPQLLSLTTTDITVRYARKKIGPLTDLNSFEDVRQDWLLNIEIEEGQSEEIEDKEAQKIKDTDALEMDETIITSKWDVLSNAQKLAKELWGMNDRKWKVMGSIWVEMLCYAAYNCQVFHHSKMLWHGGELITHVWLILLHKTDKYQIKDTKDALQKLIQLKKRKGLKPLLCF